MLFVEASGRKFIVKAKRELQRKKLGLTEADFCSNTNCQSISADKNSVSADFAALVQPSWSGFFQADARKIPLAENSVDLILTSPPYWKKRDYETKNQLGQEKTVRDYVESLIQIINGWKPALKKSGSVFITTWRVSVKKAR